MSINKVEKKSVYFKEIKFLERGEYIEFTINGFTHKVVVVGFLHIKDCMHDVLVKEIEQSGNLELLSSYDINFYECGQEYIEVDFYDDED